MQPFTALGDFWLPQQPRSVSGRLTFDGTDVDLLLFDTLTQVEMPESGISLGHPQRQDHPRVFGKLIDGPFASRSTIGTSHHVTLLDVSGFVIPIPAAEATERWGVGKVLIGAHSENESASRARLFFDALQAWASPPWLVREMAPHDGTFTVYTKEIVLQEATFEDSQYRLIATTEGGWGLNVHLDRGVCVEIQSREDHAFDEIPDTWSRPFHDLLTLCVGAPVAVTEVRTEVKTIYGHTKMASLVFGAQQNWSERSLTSAGLRERGTSALLFADETSPDFSYFLPEWLELRRDVSKVVDQLTSVFYATTMYSENRYANIFKATEELSKRCYETTDVTKKAHKERVQLLITAARESGVAAEHVEWADRVLTNRNDSPLHVLVTRLIEDAGEVGRAITASVPNAAKRMAAARTASSHGGMSTDSVAQSLLGTILIFLLRMHLLREIGLDPQIAEQRVLSARAFQRALRAMQLHTSQQNP